MFLSGRSWQTKNGQRMAGPFIWVVLPEWNLGDPHRPHADCRAFVRHVKFTQSGHWMTGRIKVGNHTQWVSGDYGGDGLPDHAPDHVWEAGVQIPKDLAEKWAKATGGWNSAGSERDHVRKWAQENIQDLRKAGRKL